MRLNKIGLVVFLLTSAFFAEAGVNLKNGNFYVGYTDIVVPGKGETLQLSRTYNSKSPEDGWYGIGWGSPFETFLKVSADGSAVIHENGAGARTRFTPKKAINPKDSAMKIVEAIRKSRTLTDKVAEEMVEKLSKNEEYRHAYARRYQVSMQLAKDTVLYSNTRGMQELKVVKDGYVRSFTDGKSHKFNKKGQLVEMKFKTGNKFVLSYDKKTGKLKSVKDNYAKQLFFEWYSDGKIKAAWSKAGKKVKYVFDEGDLVESSDVAGNTYKFSYDSNHNMTSVSYKDGSKMSMEFDKKTQFVSKVTDRNGEWTSYKYESNPKKPEKHYWTLVTKSSGKAKPITNRYEYEIKTRPDGSHYTYRILTEISSIRTETIYSECCSLPLKISRGKRVTNFEYTKDGFMKSKTSNDGKYVKIAYDQKYKKISRVENNDGWTTFKYDKRGNLSTAKNNRGNQVLLIYDSKQRISKMVERNPKSKKKRTLAFKYNSLGKPVEISMNKVGKINVKYDNFGEIKKVESKSGHRMALQVTQAFQNLLSIVKPAGVNLNM